MGVCEKRLLLEQQLGPRETRAEAHAKARGKAVHRRLFVSAARTTPNLETSDKKPWCFIASAVFESPDAPELRALRAFRDGTLRRSFVGRWMIFWYYKLSPRLAHIVHKSPRGKRFVGKMLRWFIGIVAVEAPPINTLRTTTITHGH